MHSKLVVRMRDGSLLKGFSHDFFPYKPSFHVRIVDEGEEPLETRKIQIKDIYAVFFTRDFGFARERRYTKDDLPHDIEPAQTLGARPVRVTFVWGEVLEGLAYGYDERRPAFFLFPTAPEDRVFNIERAFVTRQAIQHIEQF